MKKITIKGQNYPCRITMGALRRFKKETGRDVSGIKENDLSDIATLLWCCVVSACNADGVPFSMNIDDFADCIEPGEMVGFAESLTANTEKKTAKAVTM